MYEKFVGFTDTFEHISNQINATKATYEKALGQLSSGKGSAISQAKQLKELGLKSEKKISEKLLPPNFYEGVDEESV